MKIGDGRIVRTMFWVHDICASLSELIMMMVPVASTFYIVKGSVCPCPNIPASHYDPDVSHGAFVRGRTWRRTSQLGRSENRMGQYHRKKKKIE